MPVKQSFPKPLIVVQAGKSKPVSRVSISFSKDKLLPPSKEQLVSLKDRAC